MLIGKEECLATHSAIFRRIHTQGTALPMPIKGVSTSILIECLMGLVTQKWIVTAEVSIAIVVERDEVLRLADFAPTKLPRSPVLSFLRGDGSPQ